MSNLYGKQLLTTLPGFFPDLAGLLNCVGENNCVAAAVFFIVWVSIVVRSTLLTLGRFG